ncbi:GTP-binding protein REM 1 isoform X2 [Neocloeon triangulifer]|uniref:GTP-binding protein REM 1 isoform X2 n=1 Tax=Neocloeon triangulifer TaxID=2078957 RepID=UPI00286EB9AA|nr:GTP-binding protein REM 1 isoform X2 [Neocloeon triangulifer]
MTMDDDELRASAARKGRSASICAPGFSSMEAVVQAATQADTPQRARRAKPATRSQSARITQANKPRVTRKTRAESPSMTMNSSSCRSEPRLENIPTIATSSSDSPGAPRRSPRAPTGARRVNSVKGTAGHHHQQQQQQQHHHRGESVRETSHKRGGFLDVPGMEEPMHPDEDESYRLREFSLTSKGIVNRGDSFRRRRSRSNSLLPPSMAQEAQQAAAEAAAVEKPPPFRVALLGASGVGKTALVEQFMTSECINAYAYDRQTNEPIEQSVCISLNGEESELLFTVIQNSKTDMDKENPPHAFLVMYSVVDKASFQRAEDELSRLQEWDMLRSRPALLVGNKIDLARSRSVSTQDGKCLACTYRCKCIEISIGINHNVDELLVGILSQIRLKMAANHEGSPPPWFHRSRGMTRASMRARQMFSWMFGKEDSKFKNCENLQTL